MNTTHSLSWDATEEELDLIRRLVDLAGFQSSRELMSNALTLFKWAATESLYGRTICSIAPGTNAIRPLQSPPLIAIAEAGHRPLLGAEELRERAAGPAQPLTQILAELRGGET